MRVLVVGGGIGGAAAAAFLRQSGYAVTLSAERTQGPAGLYLAGNGMRVLGALGPGFALDPCARIEAQEVRDLKGELISSEDFREDHGRGGGPVGVPRGVLEGALRATAGAEELPGVELRELRELEAIAATPRGEERFDLVVAADGPASPLRRRFLPQLPFRETSQTLLRFLSRGGGSGAVRILGNGVTLAHFPINPSERAAVAVTSSPDLASPDALRSALGPAGASLLDGLLPSSLQRAPLLDGLPDRWHQGPLVLLGSAAHGLHPVLGQGATMAIEDARALQVALDGASSVPAALQAFDSLRRERVAAVHRAGWEQAEAARKGQLSSSFRGLLHRMLPALSPDRKLHILLLGGDLERLISHRPELAPLDPESREVLRFLVKIGQVDGRFDETERAFAKATMLEIGHNVAAKDMEDLESETRFRGAGEIVRSFQKHPREFRERLLRMGVLLAAASGRVTADEHKALREASAELGVEREALEGWVKEAIEAKDR